MRAIAFRLRGRKELNKEAFSRLINIKIGIYLDSALPTRIETGFVGADIVEGKFTVKLTQDE